MDSLREQRDQRDLGDPSLVRIGGHPRAEVLRMLHAAGVRMNAHAETLLEHPAFDDPAESTLRCTVGSVADLGLPDGGTLPEILSAAEAHGLEPVPLTAGPDLRLALLDQGQAPDSVLSAGRAPSGSIHLASPPVSTDPDVPRGFYLRVVDGLPWLRGFRCDDLYVFGPEQLFLFAAPVPPSP